MNGAEEARLRVSWRRTFHTTWRNDDGRRATLSVYDHRTDTDALLYETLRGPDGGRLNVLRLLIPKREKKKITSTVNEHCAELRRCGFTMETGESTP